jgi:hypothetical protein
MKAYSLKSLILLFILMGMNSLHAQAQLEEFPLPTKKAVTARMQQDTLHTNFPFWDDFSGSSHQPNTQLWLNSENTFISANISIEPPTYKAASLDGEDAQGYPYSTDEYDFGPTDHLTSQLIDLSGFTAEDNLYISFFWQLQGRGENPDPDDRLELQFKDNENGWHTVWQQNGEAGTTIEFKQITPIKIEQEQYFHKNFQFRFQSFGRMAGKVDNWNLDYIYLDKDRSPADTTYLDRALSTPANSIFKDYHAIPAKHFFDSPEVYLQEAQASFFNLDVAIQPLTFSALLKDMKSGQVLDTLNYNSEIRPIPRGLERRDLNINKVNPDNLPQITNEETEMLEERKLELSLFLNRSGDTLLSNSDNSSYYSHIDFRKNDTLRTIYSLEDYYAYDDGSAERTSGLNQRNGRLAQQYIVANGAYLSHIDIYFPQTGKGSTGVPIELMVWQKLENENTQPLYTQNATVQYIGVDSAYSYELSRPVWVEDTFYIGYRQTVGDYLLVGLDKNTNNGEKIFFKTSGGWAQNEKVEGSLMLRPRFAQGMDEITLGTDKDKRPKLTIFPNPSNGLFFLEGRFNLIKVYNAQGALVRQVSYQGDDTHVIDLSDQPEGIYLVWVNRKEGSYTERIVLNKR